MGQSTKDTFGILIFMVVECVLFAVFRCILKFYDVEEPLKEYLTVGAILALFGLLYLAACLHASNEK